MNLTSKDISIIELIGQGLTDKEIADRMGMKKRTVQDKIHNLLRKYDCRNRAQLVVKVLIEGLKKSYIGI